jgi:hypothetical protein
MEDITSGVNNSPPEKRGKVEMENDDEDRHDLIEQPLRADVVSGGENVAQVIFKF